MKSDLAARLERIGNEMLALAAEQKQKPQNRKTALKWNSDDDDCELAIALIRKTGRASVTHLQRKLGWGYNHAAHVIDLLEGRGIVGPQIGVSPREIHL